MNRSLNRREQAQLCFDIGQQRLTQQDYKAAKQHFEEAVALHPPFAGAYLGLAVASRQLGDWPAAETAARSALDADPRSAPTAHYLGALLVELDRLSEALPYLQAAAERAPEVAQHQRDLAVTQLFLGDIAGGRERLMRTLELDVHMHEALYTVIRLVRMNDGSPEAGKLLELARELAENADQLPVAERAQVLFALAKAYEDRGEFAAAATTYDRANAVRRSVLDYDVAPVAARLHRVGQIFDPALLKRLSGGGAQNPRPIFIVGMPRCGSTLVEQVLAAHSQVHGAGETYNLPPLIIEARGLGGALFPEWATTMNEVDCRTFADAYLARLPEGLPGKLRTTDKWLENFEYIGMIRACLPQATIIHCRRDPRDQLFSCWAMLFSEGQEYAYTMAELGTYYRAYERLMEHWRMVVPADRLLEVPYEALVGDLEGWARRILDHCGLEWDEQVLRYWEALRPVKSASLTQVREPIYDRSIGRWKPFADYLAPLFEAAGLTAKG